MHYARLSFVALSLLLPAFLCAQGTVTIYGTVTDPSAAAISGAKVTVTNEATDQSRTTTSAVDGNFVVPDLPIGSYRLNITAAGFKTFLQTAIRVQVDECELLVSRVGRRSRNPDRVRAAPRRRGHAVKTINGGLRQPRQRKSFLRAVAGIEPARTSYRRTGPHSEHSTDKQDSQLEPHNPSKPIA